MGTLYEDDIISSLQALLGDSQWLETDLSPRGKGCPSADAPEGLFPSNYRGVLNSSYRMTSGRINRS